MTDFNINFPQNPPDGYRHAEHGRVWEWRDVPGVWRSVSGGAEGGGGGGPVKWDDVQEKPVPIDSLAAGIIIGGSF